MAKKQPPPIVTVTHQQPSPFPFVTPKGATIEDETCQCGRLRSEHGDTIAYGHGASAPSPLDGSCCARFTFVEFVFRMPPNHSRLDGARSVTFKHSRAHDMGGAGWAYQVWVLDLGAVPRKLFNTTAKVLSQPEAYAHASKELQAWDERQEQRS